jgi:hypothetical protein
MGEVWGMVEGFFSGDSPAGLFRDRAGPGAGAARASLLGNLPRRLPPWASAACEGPGRDARARPAELQEALRQCRRGAGAGADGLPYEFYAAFWDLLGQPLADALNEALDSAAPDALAEMLFGVIVLIHKAGRAADLLAGFRPITLLNADVRIWAKAVANRLQVPLDELIDPEQTAFIAGRDISDRLHFLRALMACMKQRHEPLWFLLSDLANAYDSVSWDALAATMDALGFRAGGHVRWARLLHQGAHSAVVVNGHRSPWFPLRGGLMQGSGASPLYWVIVMEPLVAWVNGRNAVPWLLMPGGLRLPPFGAFADDAQTAMHGAGRVDAQPQAMLAAFDLFEAATGVGLSLPKSEIAAPVDADGRLAALYDEGRELQRQQGVPEREPVRHASGLALAAPGSASRVLGVPLTADEGVAREKAFSGQGGAVQAKAAGWAAWGLNLQARVLVAKQCLASKLVFQAQFLQPPEPHLRAVQRAIRGFVAAPAGLTEAAPRPGCLFPNEQVMAKPLRAGGLGYPLLASSCRANLAKMAAKLFWPGSQRWKALVTGFLQRAADEVGGGAAGATVAWPVVMAAAGPAGRAAAKRLAAALPPPQAAHFQALLRLSPARVVQPQALSFHQAMAEPLCWNPDVRVGEPARCLAPADLGPGWAAGWRSLGDVWRSLRGVAAAPAVDGGLAAAAEVVRGALPAPWRAYLAAGAEPPASWVSVEVPGAPGTDPAVYVLRGPGPQPDWAAADWASRLHRRLPTGRLALVCPAWALGDEAGAAVRGAAEGELQVLSALLGSLQWEAAAVFELPKPRRRWSWEDLEAAAAAAAAAAARRAARAAPGGPPGGQPVLLGDGGPRGGGEAVMEPWLLGPWRRVALDPTVWGVAGVPLLQFQVKTASAFLAGQGGPVWPRLWSRPAGAAGPGQPPTPACAGLAGLEAGWRADFDARPAEVAPAPRAPRRNEAEFAAGDAAYAAAGPAWARGPQPGLGGAQPRRRGPPRARGGAPGGPGLGGPGGAGPAGGAHAAAAGPAVAVAAAPALAGPAAGPQPGGPADPPLAPPAVPARGGALGRLWADLHGDRAVRREDTLACFRLLHGVLPVNAFRLHVRREALRPVGLCPCPECRAAGALETYTHAFMECPSAAPVLDWVLALWAELAPGGPPPPRDPLLLLADQRGARDPRGGWEPQPAHRVFWGRLRAAWVGCVWEARCSQVALGGGALPSAVRARLTAGALLERLRTAAGLQWLRVSEDVRCLDPSYPSTWFRGRDPALSLRSFVGEWGMDGLFCSARLLPAPRLVFGVGPDFPVPLPGDAGAAAAAGLLAALGGGPAGAA